MVSSVLEAEIGTEAAEAAVGGQVEQPQELLKKVPPSGRDFEVFEDVVVKAGTTRSAASKFKISQTRVCQIVARVQRWLQEVAGKADQEMTPQQLLYLAVGLAADRLDHLCSLAMVGWNSTDGVVERTRICNGERLTTRTMCHCDPRYLIAAGRLVLMRSTLPSSGVFDQAVAAAADILEGPLAEEKASTGAGAHPDGACSGNAEFGMRNAELDTIRAVASSLAAMRSDPLDEEAPAARRAFFGPVQEGELSQELAALMRARMNGQTASSAPSGEKGVPKS